MAPAGRVTVTLRERPAAMVRRVALETAAALGADAARRVSAAVGSALAPRDAAIEHDHDTRLLHPGRTVLILLSDTECREPAALAAAAFVDSVDTGFGLEPAALEAAAGRAARVVFESLPAAGPERMLEELVTAEPHAALVLLAERLDHVRHLHLRPDLDWAAFHTEVCEVWRPAARRRAPRLAQRFDRWEESFRRRLFAR